MAQLAPFDAVDYLDDEQTIAEYLTAALEDPNPDVFLTAVRDVARARGMTQLAKDSGLGRESLYKALSPGAKPRYDTVLKLVHALGIKLSASAGPSQFLPSLKAHLFICSIAYQTTADGTFCSL